MRTLADLQNAVAVQLKDVPANKDRSFVIVAGELKQVSDAAKAKVEQLLAKWKADVAAAEAKSEPTPAADPVCEIFDSYSGAANNHSAGIHFTISARKLAALLAVIPGATKIDAPKADPVKP